MEEIGTDMKTNRVTVKGGKADPEKVRRRLQRKTQKHVDLISPKPDKDAKEKAEAEAKAEAAKKEEEVFMSLTKAMNLSSLIMVRKL